MIDRNSPIKDQLNSAAKNAESIDRTYWAFVFNEAHSHIEELQAQLAEVTADVDEAIRAIPIPTDLVERVMRETGQ